MAGERLRYTLRKGEHGQLLLFDQHGMRHAIPSTRNAALKKGSPIYAGKMHLPCGYRTKYTSNGNCLACSTWNTSSSKRVKAHRQRKKARLKCQPAESAIERLINRIIYSTKC